MPVPKRNKRKRFNRTWTDEEKIAILDEVHQAKKFGRRGVQADILRKHNINTAYLVIWKNELLAKGGLPRYLQ